MRHCEITIPGIILDGENNWPSCSPSTGSWLDSPIRFTVSALFVGSRKLGYEDTEVRFAVADGFFFFPTLDQYNTPTDFMSQTTWSLGPPLW